MSDRYSQIQQIVVTADQMRQIEERVFAEGMPVAALMEKVAGLITQRVRALSADWGKRVGVLVGPGHNGGDALIVARELYFRGYDVLLYCPFSRFKELTESHRRYCVSLGIPCTETVDALQGCDWLLDGLFGFGLERPLTEAIAAAIQEVNQWSKPVVSIDLPSGLHTDTGQILGMAVRARHTLCLGLWKLGLLQDQALECVGETELIDFDLPLEVVQAVVDNSFPVRRITPEQAIAHLPLHRPPTTHKYKMGHLLLICGSCRYAGAAMLAGFGARASGVGMLSIAVPASLKPIVTAQLPEALILACPETAAGAIAQLPDAIDLATYDAIACGPGLTLEPSAIVQEVLATNRPLVLDADGLNLLAQMGTIPTLRSRQATTILTPHMGEFKRLFPDLAEPMICRVTAVRAAAMQAGAIVLLKGARVTIGNAQGEVWINPESTAALARGGSGDVLTGLLSGLLAQATVAASLPEMLIHPVQAGVWWHARAGILTMQARTVLGVDALTLAQRLLPALYETVSSQ